MIDYKKNLLFILVFISGFILFIVYSYTAEKMIYNETCTANWVIFNDKGRANLTIDFMYNKKNKTGTVALSGTWQQGNRESKSIRRNIEYTWIENYDTAHLTSKGVKEGANKRGNSSRLTQSFHFFMFEPIFSPVNALNQPI